MPIKHLRLPNTPKCRVFWKRDGTTYVSVIDTPISTSGLQTAMLAKHVAMREVTGVASVRPSPQVGWVRR